MEILSAPADWNVYTYMHIYIYTRLSLNPARPRKCTAVFLHQGPPRRVCACVNEGDREQVTERHRLESRLGRDSTSCEEPRCSTGQSGPRLKCRSADITVVRSITSNYLNDSNARKICTGEGWMDAKRAPFPRYDRDMKIQEGYTQRTMQWKSSGETNYARKWRVSPVFVCIFGTKRARITRHRRKTKTSLPPSSSSLYANFNPWPCDALETIALLDKFSRHGIFTSP